MGIGTSPTIAEVAKFILTLGHGPADVERGFSVNGNVMRDNMTPETIVSSRKFTHASKWPHCQHCGPLHSTDLLKKSVKDSQLKYLLFLEERS